MPVDRMFRDPECPRPTNPRKVQQWPAPGTVALLPLIGSFRIAPDRSLDVGHSHQQQSIAANRPVAGLTYHRPTIEQQAACFLDLNKERTQHALTSPLLVARRRRACARDPSSGIAAGFDVASTAKARLITTPVLIQMYNDSRTRHHTVLTIIATRVGPMAGAKVTPALLGFRVRGAVCEPQLRPEPPGAPAPKTGSGGRGWPFGAYRQNEPD